MKESEEKYQSIIYLEDRVKKQDREILTLKESLSEAYAESRGQNNIIKALEKTNERLLKTIENFNK